MLAGGLNGGILSSLEINARNASKGAPELQARIGLDSGPVVVDATGEVFGDAPNIAARVPSAWGRFDPFARPSANGRSLRI